MPHQFGQCRAVAIGKLYYEQHSQDQRRHGTCKKQCTWHQRQHPRFNLSTHVQPKKETAVLDLNAIKAALCCRPTASSGASTCVSCTCLRALHPRTTAWTQLITSKQTCKTTCVSGDQLPGNPRRTQLHLQRLCPVAAVQTVQYWQQLEKATDRHAASQASLQASVKVICLIRI